MLALVASAAPAWAQPTVTFDSTKVTAHWKQGYLTGSVRFQATTSEAGTFFVFIRRANGKGPVVAATRIDAGAGSFGRALKLPAQPKPGAYKLRVSHVTDAGNVLLGAAGAFAIPSPPEGVVAKAIVSRARGGRNIVSVASPVSQMWVRFRFIAPPKKGLRVRVLWFNPRAKLSGTVIPTSTLVIDSFMKSPGGAALPTGKWEARLVVGRTIARRTFVRIR